MQESFTPIILGNTDEVAKLREALDRAGVRSDVPLLDRVMIFAGKINPTTFAEKEDAKPIELSADQKVAWEKLQAWLATKRPNFVLRGYAGTGKTYLLQMLLRQGEHSFKFTAPTNKAAKVIAQMLGEQAVTIHSLLGLRMVPHEDGMRLEYPKQPPRISPGTIIVVDEASMVGAELYQFIERLRQEMRFRVIYVGDPAQLNPVGERSSPTWRSTDRKSERTMLRQVMRFDNQLLDLSIKVRACLKEGKYRSPIRDNHSDDEGVFLLKEHRFRRMIERLTLDDFINTKVIAWRNRTVNAYNSDIRAQLGFKRPYEEGEILLLGEPIEINGRIIGHTDEEGRATSVRKSTVLVDDSDEVPVWSIVFQTDDNSHRLNVPINGGDTLNRILSAKAAAARQAQPAQRYKFWSDFWETKRRFHTVRYGYALTAHRIQGSTIDCAFVDQNDILANPDKAEAFRCLYVACTRPRFKLYSF